MYLMASHATAIYSAASSFVSFSKDMIIISYTMANFVVVMTELLFSVWLGCIYYIRKGIVNEAVEKENQIWLMQVAKANNSTSVM